MVEYSQPSVSVGSTTMNKEGQLHENQVRSFNMIKVISKCFLEKEGSKKGR